MNRNGRIFFIFFLLFFQSVLSEKVEMRLIAHRGASAEAPENTLAAFRKALEMGVKAIEFDVHLTEDGVPIVIHDPHVQRTTDVCVPKRVQNFTFTEAKSLDAGSWFDPSFAGERLPSLEEVFALPRGDTLLMVELKDDDRDINRLARNVVRVLEKQSPENRKSIVIGSKSTEIVQLVKLYAPEQPVVGIVSFADDFIDHLDLEPDRLALHSHLVSGELVEALHRANVDIWVWTVDDEEEAKQLFDWGVDMVITNQVRKMKENLSL